MNGEDLKKVLRKDKVSIAELASKMNISYQLLYAYLSRDDMKTSLVEKIALATEKSPLYYYCGGDIVSEEKLLELENIIANKDKRIQELEQEVNKCNRIINALTQATQ